MIVLEQSAKPLSTFDLSVNASDFFTRLNDRVAQSLVIALMLVVLQELIDRIAHRTLPEEDHTIQALVLQTAHEPLNKRIEIG